LIPISDSVRSRHFPIVNYLLIGASVLVFLFELGLRRRLDVFVHAWGATPLAITAYLGHLGERSPWPLVTLVTSLFIHAGWVHLLGNMLFLWVFGDNVEDAMGHLGYMVFYLASGIGAGLAQVALFADSRVPLIGASGAIAGVLGAYILMFPWASVSVLVPFFFFFTVIDVPALLLLGLWFLAQFFNGLAAVTYASHVTGGVGWWAHVGGFVLGMILMPFFRRRRFFTSRGNW